MDVIYKYGYWIFFIVASLFIAAITLLSCRLFEELERLESEEFDERISKKSNSKRKGQRNIKK